MNDQVQRYVDASIGLLERGHWHEGLSLAERALSEQPHSTRLLLEYVEKAATVAAREEERHAELLSLLEGFVRGRVLHAELDDIEAIIAGAETLASRRDQLLRASDSEEAQSHSDAELEALIAVGRSGSLGEMVASCADLPRLRETLEAARDLIDAEPAVQEAFTGAVERVELAVSFDEAAKESWALLERIATWNVARAGIALQQVEAVLRPFVAFSHRLDAGRLAVADDLLERLRKTANQVARQAQEIDATERWGAFELEHAKSVKAALEPSIPSCDAPDRYCQSLLDRIRLVQEKLLPLLPTLQDTEAWGKARTYAEELARRGHELVQRQQRRHDQWALARIRRGYADANAHIGLVDDEEKIARAMVDAFGVIDVRLLGYEVQRCFNEVFELLYQHLDKLTKEQNFDAPRGKLYVLAQMLRTEKMALSEF